MTILVRVCGECGNEIKNKGENALYCESVGHISEDTIKKYIEEQKGR